ncbi:MAG: transporter substrate-binding domain-containing protein [Candidatus Omnitrophica bacterium]|nr:transporter substrate-binding domain-containing protein [Candidatus Omnitrophota bacterium]
MRFRLYLWAVILLAACAASFSQEAGAIKIERKLIVGVKEAAPFSMKNEDGEWSGISIDLWRQIADELQIDYEYREMDLKGLLEGIADRRLDVVAAALTIAPDREEKMDFTHPFHTSGLGIAVPLRHQWRWFSVAARFFSFEFLKVFALLIFLLMSVGALVWLFERRRNPDQFGGNRAEGVLSGFWWSAVTMTTVGYGDKSPVTLGGRLLGLVWMFASIIIISGITAAITSALTVNELQSSIQGPDDLVHVRVATVEGSTSDAYLNRRRIRTRYYATPLEALEDVAKGSVEAVVYDAPILRYLAANKLSGPPVQVLSSVFDRQDYGLALYQGCEYREMINRVLLRIINDPAWQETLTRYLGNPGQ